MRFLGRRLSAVVCVAAAVGMAGAAIAYATVPSSDGTITGCYSVNGAKERGGTELNVVDAQATSCARGQTSVSWNQQGPPGTPGTSVTSTALQSGDASCPNGGSEFTAANGNVTYACNGQNGTTPSSIEDLNGLGCAPTDTARGTITVSYTGSNDVTLHCTINQVETSLAAPAGSGDTNVKVFSVNGMQAGGTLTIDPGVASEETATISAVGTAAGGSTTLAAPASPGDTTIKVASVTGLTVGHEIEVAGANVEIALITAIGTAGATGTGITLASPLAFVHAPGSPVVGDLGTGITLSTPLVHAHPEGTVVDYHG